MHNKKGGDANLKLTTAKRWLAACLLCALLLAFGAVPAAAATTMIELTPGGSNLFDGMSNMMPGTSHTATVQVKNASKISADFYLMAQSAAIDDFARSQEDFDRSVALLSELDIKVELVDGASRTLLYEGKANQLTGEAGSPARLMGRRVHLGTLAAKATVTIEATVYVPDTLGNEFDGAEGKFWWNFSSEGEEPASSNPSTDQASSQPASPSSKTPVTTVPKTGDSALVLFSVGILLLALLAGAGALVVYLRSKKRSGAK